MTGSQESPPAGSASSSSSSAVLLLPRHTAEGISLTPRKATAVAPALAELHLGLNLTHAHSSESSGCDLPPAPALWVKIPN